MGRCDDCSSNFCSRLEFYDGPTANSSSLGRLCTNSELTAKISSGNQMFVKFYSSFSPDQGFLAEYSESHEPPSPTSTHASSPPSKGAESTMPTPWSSPTRPKFAFTISCFPSAMVAYIARDSLPLGTDASLLHLNDPSCGVNYVTKNSVIIKAPLKGCGTVRRNIGYKVSFHNKLVVPFGYGNKRSLFVFPFKCVYSHFGFP
ncbi:uncharacterized protein [Porites lutea]|uniref:uncharacterized protein n=1 Tax=Porites lutea TaxID=51062 RepID=UPI003CC6B44D